MMLNLLGFEMRYHFRQTVFQALCALFFCLGILMPHGSFGGPQIDKNGPYVINFIVCLLSIFLLFVSALCCANVVLRDKSHQTDALIYSTGVSKSLYLGIRFSGLLLSVSLVICTAVAGILIGSFGIPALPKTDFQLQYYLHPLVMFGLPNAFFCSSLICAVALLTQNVSAVYVSAVLLFILYFTVSILGNSPLMATSALKSGGPGLWSVLADPFGLTTFFSEVKSWPATRRNQDLFPITGALLANRLGWSCIALLAIRFSFSRFTFSPVSVKLPQTTQIVSVSSKEEIYSPVGVKSFGIRYYISAMRSQLRIEIETLFKQKLFLVLVALWVFLYAVEVHENLLHGPYDIRFFATTALVIEQLLPVRMALILLVFYASELIHREHASGMHAIVFSAPVPNAVLFLTKILALSAVITVLISCNIITGIAYQLSSNDSQISLLAYASLFFYSGFQLFLFVFFIFFIQTIVPNKYLSMMLSLVVTGLCIFGKMLGIENPLLRFGSAPEPFYTVINGFGHYAYSFHGYMLYWTFLASLLGLLTARLWPDGRHDTFCRRIRAGLRLWNAGTKITALLCLLLLICTGFYITQKSSGTALGRDNKNDVQWQKRYEQKYKAHAAAMQPVITAVKISTDIYPDEQTYSVSGKYTVKNKSASVICMLWVGVDPSVNLINLQIAGAVLTRSDKAFKQYFYQLEKPLLPGAETTLNFSLRADRSGFKRFDSENAVVSNGSYVELEKFLPFFGYNERFELDDPQIREKCGLTSWTFPSVIGDQYNQVDFENTISTAAGQQVVSVGHLKKSWKIAKRSYFYYKTTRPISFMFAVSSMRYALRKEIQNGVTYQIYYQPGQSQNLPAMMQAMKDAVRYGNAQFSPYPFKQITLAEIPAYRGAATAYPGVIFASEKYNFLVDAKDASRLNFVYLTAVHETAHQWWANKISPQDGPGSALLTESLAKYTEAIVAEKRVGKIKLSRYLRSDNELYFSLRNSSGHKELPLYKTWGQPYVHYQKGGLALYAIKECLGEERINRALAALIDRHAFPNQKPSAEDLINELTRNATPFEKTLIENHLKKVVVYDNRIQVLSRKSIGNGQIRLKLLVSVYKTDETQEKPKKMNTDDLVDVAIFGVGSSQGTSGKPIYFRKYHFNRPQTVIEVVVGKEPKVVEIDPYSYMLDSDHDNNFATF
ncbi:ABC-2 family transporter protein [Dyadobacter koreensis]|uniref:ABC-2 family transporter protein n=2 Tax=Dyadobacter koreensis TaxID=408657 RepID=A0A1H6Q8M8_9BACT|nr:ABC-2 family transporter protein [Dyadobacter koreensis]